MLFKVNSQPKLPSFDLRPSHQQASPSQSATHPSTLTRLDPGDDDRILAEISEEGQQTSTDGGGRAQDDVVCRPPAMNSSVVLVTAASTTQAERSTD